MFSFNSCSIKKIILKATFPTSKAQMKTLVVNVKNANGEIIETKTIAKEDLKAETEITLEKATTGCTYEIVFNYTNTGSKNGDIQVSSIDYLG